MSKDIVLRWNNSVADLVIEGGDLVLGNRLPTAVIVGLFTNQGQWWADPKLGSRLYKLEGEPLNQHTRQRAKAFIVEALGWLDRELIVEVERIGKNALKATITIGSNEQQFNLEV